MVKQKKEPKQNETCVVRISLVVFVYFSNFCESLDERRKFIWWWMRKTETEMEI